nr:protein-tyrosine-phosphatase MKP1-like [Ipomoea batatas]
MSKSPWGNIGDWAAEAEREEAEERELAVSAAAAAGDSQSYPSLREAASTKQKKKTKMSLQQFTMQSSYGSGHGYGSTSRLTPEEMLRLPTPPKDRSAEEMQQGFSNYGARSPGRIRDRDLDGEASWGGDRRQFGGFDNEQRKGPPSRAPDFDQSSRADEVDNWASAKKPLPSYNSTPTQAPARSKYGEKGIDWRKIDLVSEHQCNERPESEEERKLIEEREALQSSGEGKKKWNSKARACLPPLQPLSISRPKAEEWPSAGSDDLGVWPNNPPTPRVRLGPITIQEISTFEQPPREFQFKRDKLAFFNKECSKIVDHIYLGSETIAKDREILRHNGITHVLNCVGFICPEYFKGDLVYKTLWLRDSPTEDITSILYDVFDYFEDVREQGGRVFVHCCQGVSRSTSLVIAYLMWKKEQSFEDAFQHVKATRGVTNPNMGFACQLLQCQKRVHALPVSPTSVLRMYRIAPHSPYDPLHLVPKMLGEPGVKALDSRGTFLVHVPSAIYVWIGRHCVSVMSDNARAAADQVVRYEKAQGPVLILKEGEEPYEFWEALGNEKFFVNKLEIKNEGIVSARNSMNASSITSSVGLRKVSEYDLDFEIFHKAVAGGVVPPFPLSGTGFETCLPARANGWNRLRQKFASGVMKEFILSSKMSNDDVKASQGLGMIDASLEVSPVEPSSPSSPQCESPDSFSSYATSNPSWLKDPCKDTECATPEPLLSPTPSFSSLDSLSCFLPRKPKSSSTSPSLSSTSDYSSSFTFSPTSSNWSDLSYLSAQPSPSGLESKDPYVLHGSLKEDPCLLCKGTLTQTEESFPTTHMARVTNTCSPCRGVSPSPLMAECKGSHPPPRMMLTSIDETPQLPSNLVRTWSFSRPDVEDVVMRGDECNNLEDGSVELSSEEAMVDSDTLVTDSEFHGRVQDSNEGEIVYDAPDANHRVQTTNVALYEWPSMHKFELPCGPLDSRAVYLIFVPDVSVDSKNNNVLYVWIGRDVPWRQRNCQSINNDSMWDDGHIQWEAVGHNFLLEKHLVRSVVQIVNQGKEPDHLLKNLPTLPLSRTH